MREDSASSMMMAKKRDSIAQHQKCNTFCSQVQLQRSLPAALLESYHARERKGAALRFIAQDMF